MGEHASPSGGTPFTPGFTSSSTAENFFKLGLPWPDGCKAASIGPVTTATLKELGRAPSITAKTHDINGLVEAIVKAAGK